MTSSWRSGVSRRTNAPPSYCATTPGISTREVATILGCSSATVRVHLSQGRRRLRRLLEDRDA
ncbi:MAG: sigma factor-like helix-turn-helix DNA-binding protein [Actinomycetota bacterium]